MTCEHNVKILMCATCTELLDTFKNQIEHLVTEIEACRMLTHEATLNDKEVIVLFKPKYDEIFKRCGVDIE